jgi:hypothetical protein
VGPGTTGDAVGMLRWPRLSRISRASSSTLTHATSMATVLASSGWSGNLYGERPGAGQSRGDTAGQAD